MKKVTGMGIIFLIGAYLVLFSNTGFAQGLTQTEQLYLKEISDSILTNQANNEKIDSFLWEMGSYSNTFEDKVKREEIGAFYWAEYAMNSPKYSNKVYDTSTRNQLIRLSEACIGSYKIYYTKGVWKEYRFDILLLRSLVYLYSWNKDYELSLSALKEYEDEVLKMGNKSKWQLLDIYSLYSDFYNNMGLYEKEAEMNRLIKDEYVKNGCETVYDTLKLLSSIHGLIKYTVRKNQIENVFELVDEYERYFFSINFFLKPKSEYASVLEDLAGWSLNYSIKYAKQCIEDEVEYLKREHLDSISCPSCLSGLKSIQLEYYKSVEDWENIYLSISSDSIFINSHYGLYLQACLNLRKKEACINIVDLAFKYLVSEFNGLEKFHPVLRSKAIQKMTLSRNYQNIRQILFNYPTDDNFVGKYLDYITQFKAIEIGLNSSYMKTLELLHSKNISQTRFNVHRCLKHDEVLIEVSRISRIEKIKTFDGVSNGITFKIADVVNGYPFIRDILPFTYAFESGLRISDMIISINSQSTKGVRNDSVVRMFNSVSIGGMNKVEVKRKGINQSLFFSTRRDSVFNYHDTIISKYVFYIIKGNSKKDYDYYLVDSKNVDDLSSKEYSSKNSSRLPTELLPIFNQIKDSKSIYLSSDGVFNKINLETITVVDSTGAYRYFGDLYDIHVVSSARDLLLKNTATHSNKTIALFGDPDYTLNKSEQAKLVKQVGVDTASLSYLRGNGAVTGTYKFKSLPATKDEVECIGQTLHQKGWQVQVYSGANALEEQVKKVQSPRVLHIATHGFFAEDIQLKKQEIFMGMDTKDVIENPLLRSGLAFAGAERTRTDSTHELTQDIDDGILTAEEAQYLRLDSTELVVLSACETGLGTTVNGEGVYGLQRAFRSAGAKSVLMSLWNVNDIATKELMGNFYKHWLDDGMSKHDALWQAKLDLRKNSQFDSPYYWGAFVLIGE